MDYILQLVYVAMVLLIGTLASVFAYSIKTSDVFILLLTGMILNSFGFLTFDNNFIIIASTFAMIFIVFSGSLDFKIAHVKKYFMGSLKLTLVNLGLCLVVMTASMIYIFGLDFSFHSILLGALFALTAYDTDPSAILPILKGIKNKFADIIEIESVINTPIMVIPSFLILNGIKNTNSNLTIMNNPIVTFFQLIFVGALVAIIVGWLVLSILKNNYFGELTHLAVLTSAVITYAGAEYLGGSGVLAIGIYGIMFGTSHISHLIEIEKFESILTNSIKIIIFMLLGTILVIRPEYILKGSLLFLVYVIVRFISALLTLRKEGINFREALFIAINVPKGIDVALVLLLTISLYSGIKDIEIVINLVMIMILYSIALSSMTAPFANYLLARKKA